MVIHIFNLGGKERTDVSISECVDVFLEEKGLNAASQLLLKITVHVYESKSHVTCLMRACL